MGSRQVVSHPKIDLCTVQQKTQIFLNIYIHRKVIIMKVAICFVCVFAMAYAESWMAAPYTLVKRSALPEPQNTGAGNSNNPNTRLFTGNGPLDAGVAGLGAGVAAQFIANQIFNPCRGGTRNQNQNTNNRIFGGNTGNFLLGATAGFAGASVANSAAGNPCGR